MLDPPCPDPFEDGIEFVLVDQEGVVTGGEASAGTVGDEVGVDAISRRHLPEHAEGNRRSESEQVGEPSGGRLAVAGGIV